MYSLETIVAIATPAGAGGVGIVRLSGIRACEIAETICARRLQPRYAHHVQFYEADQNVVDDGIALFFVAPASFTGEDVVELQAHGSPAVLQALLGRCCALGARMAKPGEFSERAYRNGKLDLAQAEAIADLIAASDMRAARAARRSLDGEFSRRVDGLAAEVLRLRVHVEAAIDFADEPLDTLGGSALRSRLVSAITTLAALLADAERGRKLRDGLHAVIVGPPNAGKSSLLNALAGSERAIVAEIAGTTRDLLQEVIRIDGVELTLIDTAGLRDDGDAVEREGMRRARAELQRADLAIVVLDACDLEAGRDAVLSAIAEVPERLWLYNKSDLLPEPNRITRTSDALLISTKTGEGLQQVHVRLRALAVGSDTESVEGTFSARGRQVEALQRAQLELHAASSALQTEALDLAAENLHATHQALGEITGRVSPDEMLGHIFSTFCIGK